MIKQSYLGYSLIDTISMDLFICVLSGHRLKFSKFWYISIPQTVFTLANSADPDEMPPFAAFHQGLHSEC